MYNIKYLLLFFLCFALSALAIGLVLKLLKRKKILDIPNARSNHKISVPRGGGIATTGVIMLSCLILSLFILDDFSYVWPIFAAVFLLGAISWIDDFKGLGIKWRLFAQSIAVLAGIYVLQPVQENFPAFIPLWLGSAAIFMAWMWFINLYNFMDGIDGITGSQSIIIALGIALVVMIDYRQPQEMGFYSAVIIAVSLGFLLWNWHPAKIFMGDVGSVPLGFILGWLLLELTLRGHFIEALIIPAYYLFDSGYTIVKRLLERKKIWEAHSEHFYQQGVRSGKSHAKVVGIIILLGCALLGLVYGSLALPDYKLIFLIVAYMATIMTTYYFHHSFKKKKIESGN